MRRFRSSRVLALAVVAGIAILGWAFITPANSQPISKGNIGAPGSNNVRPGERVASYRLVWYGNNRAGTLVMRTTSNQEHSLPQLGADQLHSLVQLLQTEKVYFEGENQILYTEMKRTTE